jgi:hypothetical protein
MVEYIKSENIYQHLLFNHKQIALNKIKAVSICINNKDCQICTEYVNKNNQMV